MHSHAGYVSPKFYEDMHSRADYMSPEFCEDVHSRANHVSPEFCKDGTYLVLGIDGILVELTDYD
ncbi:unnamed protein product [Prunus armeniaca]